MIASLASVDTVFNLTPTGYIREGEIAKMVANLPEDFWNAQFHCNAALEVTMELTQTIWTEYEWDM